MRGTLTGGSVGLLRYPAMLPCFSRLWGMILHCRKSPCRLEITADSRGLASGFSCLGDHPRVCGEHHADPSGPHPTGGSSPRMRGTPAGWARGTRSRGIIPAYAGNTIRCLSARRATVDHPRVCGEHFSVASHLRVNPGSSPRMRGTLAPVIIGHVAHGIIPAYAGNTPARLYRRSAVRDHPRVCGEHSERFRQCGRHLGSSPRMRGTLATWPSPKAARRDHPRVCGEHRSAPRRSAPRKGSSPRMRGTHLVNLQLDDRAGIIPAYAGNTRMVFFLPNGSGDHPRVCGEHGVSMLADDGTVGSSPRMRGTRHWLSRAGQRAGIIPAYAGNT